MKCSWMTSFMPAVAVLFMLGLVGMVSEEAAAFERGGRGGGGGGGGGRSLNADRSGSMGGGSVRFNNARNLPANRQQLQQNPRNMTGQAQQNRTQTAQQAQQNRTQTAQQAQQNRANAANEWQQNRQDYREDTREDWQDYCDNRNCGYGGNNYYYRPGYPAPGAVAAGMAVGAAVASLPKGCTTVYSNGVAYRNCGGTYYQPSGNSYVVVAPPPSGPVGTTVAVLPAGATVTTIGGVRYHVVNGAYYRPYISNGRTVYVVSRP